jgi:hypothetical protein
MNQGLDDLAILWAALELERFAQAPVPKTLCLIGEESSG